MMSKQETIDDPMPSATATDDDIRRWRMLPEEEKQKRLIKALNDGFDSGVSDRTMDEIWETAKSKAFRKNGSLRSS